MGQLKYASELEQVVEVKDTMTAEEAIILLGRELLGEEYSAVEESCNGKRAIAITTNDILRKYSPKKNRHRWN